jgi:hypothetical protein
VPQQLWNVVLSCLLVATSLNNTLRNIIFNFVFQKYFFPYKFTTFWWKNAMFFRRQFEPIWMEKGLIFLHFFTSFLWPRSIKQKKLELSRISRSWYLLPWKYILSPNVYQKSLKSHVWYQYAWQGWQYFSTSVWYYNVYYCTVDKSNLQVGNICILSTRVSQYWN